MVIVVGSGAGGGLIGMELALKNIPVTIIEKGPYISSKDAFNYYVDSNEGIDLLKTSCVGGSTIVSAGNGVRSLENELLEIGTDLSNEFIYIEELLNIHCLNDSHLGKGSELFLKASKRLNLNVSRMPKFIMEEKCTICGKCSFGCPFDAKWSSKDFIDIAVENGAEFISNCECTELLVEDNKILGVKAILNNNEEKIFKSNKVILAAGAINSAVLLRKIGIPAGEKIFTDPFVTVGGVLEDINLSNEVSMNGLVTGENFILAPHFSTILPKEANVKDEDIFSIMVKIPDEGKGRVLDNGDVEKINTIKDIKYLSEGIATAGAILKEVGVDSSTIVSTELRSAHPQGTCAIGEIVNENLETKIKGLFLADGSVLPTATGKPPIVTILALSKRLADYLIN